MQYSPSDQLKRLASGERVLALGLISGTSADGIDTAAVELWREDEALRLTLRAFETIPYSDRIRAALFRCFANEATVREVCLLNAEIGEAFAAAAEQVACSLGAGEPIAFVATHGQTVWHEPEGDPLPATLQLGEAARIAERLGVPVVCDFRQQDLALGGQGAPLVPYLDYLLFADAAENRAVQNLGGIGNVTYLRAGGALEQVVAFDTGPANALLDRAAELLTNGALSYDRDGALAAGAPVDDALLRRLMSEPYLELPPPKSTGRELFSAGRVDELWEQGYRDPGLLSTLTQFTVETVAHAYRRWLGPVDTVILGGGGARNAEVVRRLRALLAPAPVRVHEEFGINGDAKEAMAFAVMGYETLRGLPSNVPSATGARRPAVLGKVCWP
jgi:anhydro-N-acetylmuramic acid kinase